MVFPGIGRTRGAHGLPGVRGWVVDAAVIALDIAVIVSRGADRTAAPYDHLAAGPHGSVVHPGGWGAGKVSRGPGIGERVVAASTADIAEFGALVAAAPYDHLAAAPHGGMQSAGRGCADGGCGCPGIGGGVVARPEVGVPAPHDHLDTRPHGSAAEDALGQRGGWGPGIILGFDLGWS